MRSRSPFYQDKCAEAKAKKKAEYMKRKSKTTQIIFGIFTAAVALII